MLLFKHVMQDVSDGKFLSCEFGSPLFFTPFHAKFKSVLENSAVQLRALSLLCACVIRRIIPQENALIFIGICTTHDSMSTLCLFRLHRESVGRLILHLQTRTSQQFLAKFSTPTSK